MNPMEKFSLCCFILFCGLAIAASHPLILIYGAMAAIAALIFIAA